MSPTGLIRAFVNGNFRYFINDYLTQFGDREAIVFQQRRIRYNDMIAEVNRFSNGLRSLGVNKGDRVGIWMPNNPEWLHVLLGVTQIGGIAVLMNSSLNAKEAEYIINQSGCKFVVVEDQGLNRDYLGAINQADSRSNVIVVNSVAPHSHYKYESVIEGQSASLEHVVPVEEKDTAVILYTSGSTGRPKGVVLSQGSSIRKPFLLSEYYEYNVNTKLLLSIPLNGVFGYSNGALAVFAGGGTVVLRPKFDAAEDLKAIEEEKCTDHYTVRVTLKRMMEHPEFQTRDLSSLKGGTFGAPTTIDISREVQHAFDAPRARGGYGMSETVGPVVHISCKEMCQFEETVAGKLLPGYQIKIVDPDTLQETDGVGEVWIKGFAMLDRYYDMQEETDKAIVDGWLRTGDLGELKEDYLFFRGRIKDIIRTKGNNISCLEIESLIKSMEQVNDAAVVPKPHPIHEEVGVAFVLPRRGANLDAETVLTYCKQHLAAYKVPHEVIIVDDLPINVHGKIRKLELQEKVKRSAHS